MSESVYELAREDQSSKSLASKTSVNAKPSTTVCRICLSNIVDTASLTCGHKFCEGCLENYWDSKDRPDSIVCPLCRSNVANVNFTKKEQQKSTNDFRKTFNTLQEISECEERRSPLFSFKFSIFLPAAYYLSKYIFLQLKNYFNFDMGYKML